MLASKDQNVPDDPVGATADGHDGRLVLGRDLELVAEYVVQEEPAAVRHRRPELGHRSAVHSDPLSPKTHHESGNPPNKSPPASCPLRSAQNKLDHKQHAHPIDFMLSPRFMKGEKRREL